MRIGALAERTGVTVRALRHYERLGLVVPMRSEAGQRVYGAEQVSTLQRVLALKKAGFPLADIKALLERRAVPTAEFLAVQRVALLAERDRLDQAVAALDGVLQAMAAGASPDLGALFDLIKLGEMTMTDAQWQKVYDQVYTQEEQERWKEAKAAIPEDVVRRTVEAWPQLIARVQAIVDTSADPASPEAIAAAAEWNELLTPLFDFDPKLLEGAGKLYANVHEWPEGSPEPPFSKEVADFIRRAGAAA